MFFVILFLALVLLLGFPYIKLVIRRIAMACRLMQISKKNNFKIYPTHFCWWLGSRFGRACDLYLETKEEIYSIKLFGNLRKLSVLTFKDNYEYFIRYCIPVIAFTTSTMHNPIKGKTKSYAYNFRKKFHADWETKRQHNILLINPMYREIRYQPDIGGERIIGTGEVIYNCKIENLSHLISELEISYE